MTNLHHLFKPSRASAEFYALEKYHNAKISDYSSIGEFIVGLQTLAFEANWESWNLYGRIEPQNIAMHIIHLLPPLHVHTSDNSIRASPRSDISIMVSP